MAVVREMRQEEDRGIINNPVHVNICVSLSPGTYFSAILYFKCTTKS